MPCLTECKALPGEGALCHVPVEGSQRETNQFRSSFEIGGGPKVAVGLLFPVTTTLKRVSSKTHA